MKHMNFEDLDRQIQLKKALAQAGNLLGERIGLMEFVGSGGYSAADVGRDLKRVNQLEHEFSLESKGDPQKKVAEDLARVIEAIISDNLELSNWMGENVHTVPVSVYDDFVNGVDTIVEFEGDDESPTSHLVFGIDVTIASEMEKKFARIRSEIDHDELATVKYFYSESLGQRKQMHDIPRVVIAIGGDTAWELVDIWTRPTGGKKILGEHFIQHQILEEIEIQLKTFSDYCNKIGKKNLVDIYDQILKLIRDIRAQKPETNRKRDSHFFDFKSQLGHAFRIT